MSQLKSILKKDVDKHLVILICREEEKKFLEDALKDNFKIRLLTTYEEFQYSFRSNQIGALISKISKTDSPFFELTNLICAQYSSIPKIAIINDLYDIELIRKCGEIGIDSVALSSDLKKLNTTINDLVSRKGIRITLEDFQIEYTDFPYLLQKALLLIESNHSKILYIEDISNQLGISYSLLSNLVKKSPLINLKRILLAFKIRYSLYLLKSNCLSIQEISSICGFSNEKRYREGLKRLFDKNPTECQCELMTTSVIEFWNKTNPILMEPCTISHNK